MEVVVEWGRTPRETVSENTTSGPFRILIQNGTGGNQNLPLRSVPQLIIFHFYSSFDDGSSILRKNGRKQAIVVRANSVAWCMCPHPTESMT